ncbi:MAG: ferritin [Chloroflexota bacterium]|nr:MAG: ferritin [Anaerolineaceae bacterium 4572_5.2]RLD06720.1 MAG: ferritin [Chloroflexota bacterium]
MFSGKLHQAMNDQVHHEFESAYIYLSMAAYFDAANFPGFAHWMKIQYQEEVAHTFKFYDFINERGGQVKLQPIGQPPVEFNSPLHVFEAALAHEKKITADIHALYELALEEKDYPSQSFLQWFIDEQVEEEQNAGDVVANLKMVGDNPYAILMLDRELGQRQPPVEDNAE